MSANYSDRSAELRKAFDAFFGMNLRHMDAELTEMAPRSEAVYKTTCRITGYRKGLIIIFTAEKPIFRVPSVRKPWALFVTMVAAVTIRDYGGSLLGVDYIGLTDIELDRDSKVAPPISAAFAEKLQRAVHDGKLDAAVAMEDLDRHLRLER
jgi:hypothetical protein